MAPDLMEGSGMMKSFSGNYSESAIVGGVRNNEKFWGQKFKKMILNPKSGYICLMLAKKSNAEAAC